jgi:hypothetical protein
MDDNVKSFLEKINEIKSDKLKVDVISTGKQIECEPLTFKQQKEIISTITEGIVGALKFQKVVNDAILENTGDKNLTVVDRLLISLQLRSNSVGTVVKFDDEKYDVLSEVIEKLKSVKPTTTKKIQGIISLELEIPTLVAENQIITSCVDILKKDADKDIGKSVGDIYTFEIVKYIKNVTIGEDSINFSNLAVRDRVKIVNNLPLVLNKEITAFIQAYKTLENDALTVRIKDSDRLIDVDVAFFDS